MPKRNEAFFCLYENFFLELKKSLGRKGVKLWQKVMFNALMNAFKFDGARKKSGINSFIKFVGKRDNKLGLKVSFKKTRNGFIYRFAVDPFPGLKGKTSIQTITESYLNPKKEYFLGSKWRFKTSKHFWKGDNLIEHVFWREN